MTIIIKYILILSENVLMAAEDDIWKNLIKLYNIEDHFGFNRELDIVFKYDSMRIIDSLIYKHFYSKYVAEESAQEAYLELMNDFQNNSNLMFENYRSLYNYVYTIAIFKAKEIKRKLPKYEDFTESDAVFNPEYLNNYEKNIFREIYDGRKDIDKFVQKEVDCLNLLQLKFIEKYSYEELLAMNEYSAYNAVSLRQKVSRSLKKYKDFIKD